MRWGFQGARRAWLGSRWLNTRIVEDFSRAEKNCQRN